MSSIYVIGSLRNPEIPRIGRALRETGLDTFEDWHSAGPRADDHWKEYEVSRGRTFQEALDGYACKHVFDFDSFHINRCDAVLLVLPAGKSGHLELGYAIGRGKRGFILLDDDKTSGGMNLDSSRWDIMYRFAEKVFVSEQEMLEFFKSDREREPRESEGEVRKDEAVPAVYPADCYPRRVGSYGSWRL